MTTVCEHPQRVVSVNVTTNLCQIVHYVILCYDEREIVLKVFTFINQGVVKIDRVAPGLSEIQRKP